MQRTLLSIILALAALTAGAKNILVNTPNTTLLLTAEQGKTVYVQYYGDRIEDASQVRNAQRGRTPSCTCSGYGKDFFNSFALSVVHSDGDLGTDLCYVGDKYN